MFSNTTVEGYEWRLNILANNSFGSLLSFLLDMKMKFLSFNRKYKKIFVCADHVHLKFDLLICQQASAHQAFPAGWLSAKSIEKFCYDWYCQFSFILMDHLNFISIFLTSPYVWWCHFTTLLLSPTVRLFNLTSGQWTNIIIYRARTITFQLHKTRISGRGVFH